jgi:hypothetical protein
MLIAAAGSLLPITSISAPGIWLAKMDVAPKKHINSPGQPHSMTDAMVAIIPVFLFIVYLL